MGSFTEVFLSTQTIFLCLGVYMLTFVIRRIVESTQPKVKSNRYWREIFVPIAPIANGIILGLVSTLASPDVVGESVFGRVLYGATCGLFSGWAYGRVRSFLTSKGVEVSNLEFPSNSIPPLPDLEEVQLEPVPDDKSKP